MPNSSTFYDLLAIFVPPRGKSSLRVISGRVRLTSVGSCDALAPAVADVGRAKAGGLTLLHSDMRSIVACDNAQHSKEPRFCLRL